MHSPIATCPSQGTRCGLQSHCSSAHAGHCRITVTLFRPLHWHPFWESLCRLEPLTLIRTPDPDANESNYIKQATCYLSWRTLACHQFLSSKQISGWNSCFHESKHTMITMMVPLCVSRFLGRTSLLHWTVSTERPRTLTSNLGSQRKVSCGKYVQWEPSCSQIHSNYGIIWWWSSSCWKILVSPIFRVRHLQSWQPSFQQHRHLTWL